MANKDFRMVRTSISTPTGVEDFKKRDQVIWTNQNRHIHSAFTPTHGWKQNLYTDNAYGTGSLNNIFSATKEEGLRWTNNKIGNEHQNLVEVGMLEHPARWMPASIFNGFGFEVYQNSDAKHALFYAGCALSFYNGSTWRTYGVQPQDGKGDSKSSGYRYIYMNNSSNITEIRNWGSSYKLTGINLWMRNAGGAGSDEGISIYMYNLKFFHQVGDDRSNLRIIPAGKRSWSQRGANSGFVPFTNPLI